uniref:HD domain-containing protein n=1 Tax=Oryza meridionalis TaxID=40149 RepID=A0A0E0EZ55_9ORYZ
MEMEMLVAAVPSSPGGSGGRLGLDLCWPAAAARGQRPAARAARFLVDGGLRPPDNAEDMSIVERFLEEVELEQGQREEIVAIIKGMGFKNEVSKKSVVEPTLEFAIVQDADRLDAIGAIGNMNKCSVFESFPKTPAGIARCFTYGGSKKNTLHDPKILPRDNLSKEKYMSKDEKQTSINHFHEKLFKLKDMMKTEAGKKRAEKRHKFMEDFVAEFYEEWSGRA